MSLMFSRLARNFVKNGYFPTDDETLSRILGALAPSEGRIQVFDPCCGEGTALANLAYGLANGFLDQLDEPPVVESFGVEFDAERALHAKKLLDRAIHADVQDVIVKPKTVGMLFLNPPYGFGLRDDTSDRRVDQGAERTERMERTFLKRCAPVLAIGGVLIYIIPYYALDDEIRTYLARNFIDLRFFMAPEQQFQQCVVMGVKRAPGHPSKDVLAMLADAQSGKLKDWVLPEQQDKRYTVPAGHVPFEFRAVRIDGPQLEEELERWRSSLLWTGFDTCFNQLRSAARRPLREMTKWHLALALAAGQVTGCIRSKEGRVLLIKGDTFKKKERRVEQQADEKGNVSETVTLLDRFVPVINAIEFTPGDRLGQIVKIS